MPILPERVEPQLDAMMPRPASKRPACNGGASSSAPERDARDRELAKIEDKPQWDQTEIDQCLVKLAKVGRVAVVVVAAVVVVVVVVVVGPVSRRRWTPRRTSSR